MFMALVPNAHWRQGNNAEECKEPFHDERSPEDRLMLEVVVDDEHARHEQSGEYPTEYLQVDRRQQNGSGVGGDNQQQGAQKVIPAQQPVFGREGHRCVNEVPVSCQKMSQRLGKINNFLPS